MCAAREAYPPRYSVAVRRPATASTTADPMPARKPTPANPTRKADLSRHRHRQGLADPRHAIARSPPRPHAGTALGEIGPPGAKESLSVGAQTNGNGVMTHN